MWDKLTAVYEQKSELNIYMQQNVRLQQKWYSITKADTDNIATHIAKLEDIAHRLSLLDEKISDTIIITKILMTLPVCYNHFVSAWESAAPTDRTFTNLKSRLTIEEALIIAQSENETKALVSKSQRRHYKSRRDGKSVLRKRYYFKVRNNNRA